MNEIEALVYELHGPRELKIVKHSLVLDEDDQIIAKTAYSAISPGTELSAWLGKPPLRPSKIYPRLQGYCNIAKVQQVGKSVSAVKVGDLILTHQSHRSHFRIYESEILVAYSDLTDKLAKQVVNTYLFHLGYSALLKARYFPGHKVAVIGFGALGYTTASLIAAFGGKPTVVTSNPTRASIFERGGINVISKEQAVDDPKSQDIYDYTINTSDSWDDYLLSLKLLRLGGEAVLLGFPGRGGEGPAFNPLDSSLLYDKQLSLKYAGYVCESDLAKIDVRFNLKRNMMYLSDLIIDSKLETKALDGFVLNWRQLDDMYKQLEGRLVQSLGGILKWN